jgi:DNA polymerase-3 subunit alpha
MRIAVFDTETTGIIRGDHTSPDAPYLAAIALAVYDTERQRVEASLNTLILPTDWTMPPEAGAVNGLDDEMLQTYGLPVEEVLPNVVSLLLPCDPLVGHNVLFDVKILAAALYRNGMLGALDALLGKTTFCTMNESKQIVQAKNVKGHLKFPKLTEAYEFAFDRPLDGAHSANADVIATLEIYLWLQSLKAETTDDGISL